VSLRDRWVEAFEAGIAPRVCLAASHISVLEFVDLDDLKQHALDTGSNRLPVLELVRLLNQRRNPLQHPPCAAAVQHAVVEAQRQIRFHHRDELLGFRIPLGSDAARTHA